MKLIIYMNYRIYLLQKKHELAARHQVLQEVANVKAVIDWM